MIFFISLVFTSIFLAFINAQGTLLFDMLMDFGHIFGKVRYKAAMRALEQIMTSDNEPEVRKLLSELKSLPLDNPMLDFNGRIEEADRLYWIIAKYNKKFLLWICRFCISTRAAFATTLVGPFILLLVTGAPVWVCVVSYFPMICLVLVFNSLFIKWQ